MFIVSNFAFCWVNKSGILDLISYSNPYNDKEVVLTGITHSSNVYMSCVIDMVSGKGLSTELDLLYGSNLKRTIINGVKKRIGYLADSKIHIYNYINMVKIAEIYTGKDWNNSNTKICFSKDGTLIYVFEADELRLTVYEVDTGIIKEVFLIDSNPKLYSAGYLNGDKEEFAIVKNDSMEFWSIATKTITRKIPFNSKSEKVEFRNNGDNITLVLNSNNFIILNSNTGTEIFNKICSSTISNYELSANMQFLICNSQYESCFLYDIKSDTIIQNSKTIRNYLYINSDYSKVIGSEDIYFSCNHDDMPTKSPSYFLYDLQKLNKITSIPEGLVLNPWQIFSNDQNNRIAVVGKNDSIHYYTAILDENGDFIKYIHTQEMPVAFTSKSDYLVSNKAGKLFFYNIDKDSLEKVLETGRNYMNNIFFINKNKERIVTENLDYMDVFDYESFNLLHTIDLKSLGKTFKMVHCDIKGNIKYFVNDEFYSFDVYTGTSTPVELSNIPSNAKIETISSDGNHLLLSINNDSLLVYDVLLQKISYTYKIKEYSYPEHTFSKGFLGNYTLLWYSYRSNPMDDWTYINAYDLEKGIKVGVSGYPAPYVSKDGLYYGYVDCPYIYGFSHIPKEVSVNDDLILNNNLLIYPNPSSDYIEINFDAIADINPTLKRGVDESSDIQIFNSLGESVLSVEQTSPSVQKIDISNFSSGIYFIKIGNRVEKFVKR
jgi:hypothetical protein